MADFLLLIALLSVAAGLGAALCYALRPFPVVAPPPCFVLRDDHIARIVHEANRAYCISLGDFSHRSWQNTSPEIRATTIRGVRYLRANPSATPEQMHENWKRDKVAQGWRYGPKKCAEAKTHPCIVPYCELPTEQRFKDYLFSAIVRLTVAASGR